MSFSATLADSLLPPSSLALAGLAAILLPRIGRPLATAALTAMALLSVPIVSTLLIASLTPPSLTPSQGYVPETPPDAIVILGGDVERTADPAGLDPGALTLERVRAGAALERRAHLPILVSGGFIGTAPQTVAAVMARSLVEDFMVPVRWTEASSRDTWENAQQSASILRQAGITRIYLVTHDWHMRRSLLAFRHFGIEATPAPVRTESWLGWRLGGLVPRASAWQSSYYALHEWAGVAFYSMRR